MLEAVAFRAQAGDRTDARNDDLAELSGTSRATVIRSLGTWEARGVLGLSYSRGGAREIVVLRPAEVRRLIDLRNAGLLP